MSLYAFLENKTKILSFRFQKKANFKSIIYKYKLTFVPLIFSIKESNDLFKIINNKKLFLLKNDSTKIFI